MADAATRERAESASQYRAETVRTNDLKEQIELDVRLALDSLQSAEQQVKVAQEGLELANNELTQARRRYDAGVAISVEVTDAQTRLERARDNQPPRSTTTTWPNRSGAGHGQGPAHRCRWASGGPAPEAPITGVEHMKKRIIIILIWWPSPGPRRLYLSRRQSRRPRTASWSPATSSSPKSTSPSRPPAG